MFKTQVIVICLAAFLIPIGGFLIVNKDRIVLEDRNKGRLLYFAKRG